MRALSDEEISSVSGGAKGSSTGLSLITLGDMALLVVASVVLGLFGKSLVDLY